MHYIPLAAIHTHTIIVHHFKWRTHVHVCHNILGVWEAPLEFPLPRNDMTTGMNTQNMIVLTLTLLIYT